MQINFFLASPLLITFANSFDLDEDQQNVSPDLVPNGLTSERVNFETRTASDKKKA